MELKATGIVRRVDNLGRYVIPKEVRRTSRINEGDPLEMFTGQNGEITLKKYSPVGSLGSLAQEYADVLCMTSRHPVLVCDRDLMVAVSGRPKKAFISLSVSDRLDKLMENRMGFTNGGNSTAELYPVEGNDSAHAICGAPIIASGDVCGYIMFLGETDTTVATKVEKMLIATAAAFLGKQIEG